MDKAFRIALLAFLVGGLSVGLVQPAISQSGAELATIIPGTDFIWIFAPVKIEDIAMCENGTDAWAVGIGPGPFDDALLFKITGVDTASPSVDQDSFIEFPDPFLDGSFPAGMGPRGFPGLTVDGACSSAYMVNFFLDTVVKVDLRSGSIVWPANYTADTAEDLRSIPAPVDVQLADDNTLIVSSADGELLVLDAGSGATLSSIETTGVGAGSVVGAGKDWVAVVENSRNLTCVDLLSKSTSSIEGLGINPFMAVANRDRSRFYVSNQGSNTVSVLAGAGCGKSVIATIDVGNAPRHLALSSDDRFLYVSNSTDNTVSVISTASLSVVSTIEIAPNEPAPVGLVTVSKNNRYLYVFWEGGPKGTPGTFHLKVYDVSGLY